MARDGLRTTVLRILGRSTFMKMFRSRNLWLAAASAVVLAGAGAFNGYAADPAQEKLKQDISDLNAQISALEKTSAASSAATAAMIEKLLRDSEQRSTAIQSMAAVGS